MDDSKTTCTNCGQEIPLDAPWGACPACSMKLALATGIDEPPDSGHSGEIKLPADLRENVKERLSAEVKLKRRLHRARWILSLVLLATTSYVASRLVWAQQHFRPNIVYDRQGNVAYSIDRDDSYDRFRLSEVNGIEVHSRAEIFRAYESGPGTRVPHIFDDGMGTAVVFEWIRAREPYSLSIERLPDGTRAFAFIPDILELREGEYIQTLNGVAVDDFSEAPNSQQVNAIPDEFGSVVTLGLGSRISDETRNLKVHYFDFGVYWTRLLIAVGFSVIGLVAFWLQPGTRSSLGFLIFTLGFAAFWTVRSVPFQYRHELESAVYLVLQCFLPLATLAFALTFTSLRRSGRGARVWSLAVGAVCALLLIVNFLKFPDSARVGLLDFSLFGVWFGILLSLLLLTLFADTWLWLRHVERSPLERSRAWIIRIGLLGGFAFPVLYWTILMRQDLGEHLAFFADASVLIFPLVIGYAIVRHNFLRLSELALESVVYGVLILGVLIGYASGASLVFPLTDALFPDGAAWQGPVLMAGVLGLATPIHTYVRRKVDARFQRLSFDPESFIGALDMSEQAKGSLYDLCQALVKLMSRFLHIEHLAVFIHYPGQDNWALSAISPVPETGQTTESCATLLAILEEERSELFQDDLIDNLRYRFVQEEALRGMQSVHAVAVFPLTSRNQVVGALCLGSKSAGGGFSKHEVTVLKRILSHVAGMFYTLMGQVVALEGRRIADIYPDYPERIGAYEIEKVIGEGGMAYVFLGARGGSHYAIKVPSRMVQSSSILLDRFQREIQAIQRITHENIVAVEETGWEGPEPFIAFEYFPQGSMGDELKRLGTFPVREVVEIGLQVTRGLAAAAAQGVIHRDIKPNNLYRDANGTVKIADFGLAKLSDVSSLTLQGQVFGTPDYISPEMLEGGNASIQSDQYALGVTLFEMLIGTVPLNKSAENLLLMNNFRLDRSGTSVHDAADASALTKIIEQLLKDRPEERYGKYEELQRELEKLDSSMRTEQPT